MEVYGYNIHHNDGTHLDGVITDNFLWQHFWWRLTARWDSWYMTPLGAVVQNFTADVDLLH